MKNLYSLLAFVMLLLSVGCSDDDALNASTQNPVDIYVIGQNNSHAAYWKNNQMISLNDNASSFSTADSIIVKNDIVHIVGTSYNNGVTNKLYWKNGVVTNLTQTFSTPDQAVRRITGMDVVGNDVYFVGYTKNPIIAAEIYDLVYWKNGIKTVVKSNTNKICDSNIKVLNNDVYIIGTDDINNFPNGYYKNGVFTNLPNTYIEDFAVNNNEMCVFGQSMFNVSNNFIYNTNTGNYTVINFTDNSEMKYLSFDNTNMYYANDHQVYKNGTLISQIQDGSAYYNDIKILNDNVYSVKSFNGVVFNQTVEINNTIVLFTNNTQNSYRSLYVVQN
jgi:hypothetical protein